MLGKVLLQIHNIHHYQVNEINYIIIFVYLICGFVVDSWGSNFHLMLIKILNIFPRNRAISVIYFIKKMLGTKLLYSGLYIFIRTIGYILNNFVVHDRVMDSDPERSKLTVYLRTRILYTGQES